MTMLDWPNLVGALTASGDICLGISKIRSHSKKGRTRFEFLRPSDGTRYTTPAHDVVWSGLPSTLAVLREGLREIVNRKVEVPFTRGPVATRAITGTGGPRLYLYEVHRDTLFPRYWWPLPYGMEQETMIKWAIWMETLSRGLVGLPDDRAPVWLKGHWPENTHTLSFCTNDLRDWVRDVQEKLGPCS